MRAILFATIDPREMLEATGGLEPPTSSGLRGLLRAATAQHVVENGPTDPTKRAMDPEEK